MPQEPYTFRFVAGHPALDFANTVSWRLRESPVERLQRPKDLDEWFESSGLFPDDAPVPSRPATWRRSLALREAVYRISLSVIRRAAPAPADLDLLGREVKRATRRSSLVWEGDRIAWSDDAAPRLPDALLAFLARAASDLLTSPNASRISQCQDEGGCGWLFLDRSRSRKRQWCSMADCGNRAKARRHYNRKRP